ncbi:class I SAM-dependent methyltransferase [Phyllobacterium sp. 21LDTY02-6]|uniref:class I SAM-dependent DNA methyltransferase n=1 Tax=Phyllobacterium sp. 21LDTY02-6 TaxID=2944903 RepID=UPI0020218697|nr:class I SAM-dependent methyltransferase [Phyllobacterium sp. 21LDTY02-6]MCO4317733.1 class I SAM-dependent methyltransferase [Phyllobacterium sp. 21LDTY02-6]
MTIEFYNSNAAEYAADWNTHNPRLFSFLNRCKPGGRILELGTGGGVDAQAILNAGFHLDATDGSAELAAIASARIGQPVRTMVFNELCAIEEYDGVYACASLTHAPRNELGPVIQKIYSALVDGGIVWASFKTGTAEGLDGLGRYYNYLSVADLMKCWHDNAPWTSLDIECWTGGAYDQRPTEWAAITAVR